MVEPWRTPGRRSLFLPFGKPAEEEGAEDDRVQLVVGVALEVRDSLFSKWLSEASVSIRRRKRLYQS